jgi:predicted RNA-binding protein with PIN domain
MHIIIDGYNMIRQSDTLRRHERFSLEAGRNALIHRASLYKKHKGHRVTIVFDGWESGSAMEERDRQEGIEIIYSRRGEKADDVIKRMVEKKMGEIVVVTSDRVIADFVNRRGATSIPSPEFESRIERTTLSAPDLTPCDDVDSKDTEEEIKGPEKKKGPSRRLSRKKKTAMAMLRKL